MLIAVAVLGTNLVVAYATYRLSTSIILKGVRSVLHHMGGEAMEAKFLDHADQLIEETQAAIRDTLK